MWCGDHSFSRDENYWTLPIGNKYWKECRKQNRDEEAKKGYCVLSRCGLCAYIIYIEHDINVTKTTCIIEKSLQRVGAAKEEERKAGPLLLHVSESAISSAALCCCVSVLGTGNECRRMCNGPSPTVMRRGNEIY